PSRRFRRRVQPSASSCGADAGDEVAVPERAALRDAHLSGEVDVDDAEALVVALFPLEVVQQRPDAVAADVDAVGDGSGEGGEVALEVGGARGVLDVAVDGGRIVEAR